MGVYDYDVPDFLKVDTTDALNEILARPVPKYVPPPAPAAPEEGYLTGIGKSLVRGIAEIPVAAGHAMEWNEDFARTGDETKKNFINKLGKGIADTAETVRDAIPQANPGDSVTKQAVFGGIESLPLSAAYAIPSTAGAIIAGAAATPESLGTGTLPAAIAGAAAGQALSAPIMFRAGAQDTYEQLKKQAPNADPNAVVDVAKKAGHKEWQGEAISDIPEAVIFSRIPGLKVGVDTVKQILKPGVKQFAKNVALSMPGEQLGENYTSYYQTKAVNSVLPQDQRTDPWDAVKQTVGPTAVMTLLMAGLGTGVQHVRANNIVKTLQDPEADAVERGKAAGQVYGLVEEAKGKEAADNFLRHAYLAIGDEKTTGSKPFAMDLNDPALLEPFGAPSAKVDMKTGEIPMSDTDYFGMPQENPPHPAIQADAQNAVGPLIQDEGETVPAPEVPKGPLTKAIETTGTAVAPVSEAVTAPTASVTRSATPGVSVPPIQGRTTNELVLDEARDWAKQQIKGGNTSLMLQLGERPDSYNKRLIDTFNKRNQQAPAVTPPATNLFTGELPLSDDEILDSINAGDRQLLEAARERVNYWEKGSMQNGRSNKTQLFPWLDSWGKTTPAEVGQAITNFLDGKKLGDVQKRLIPAALQWERENRVSRGVAPIQGISDLVAERRGLAAKGTAEQPQQGLDPEIMKRANLYAEKAGMDLAGWTDAEIAGFVKQYDRYVGSKSRAAAPPIQGIAGLIAERRGLKGAAGGKKTTTGAGEGTTGTKTVPPVRKLDGQTGDGMPVVQSADENGVTGKGGVQDDLSKMRENVGGKTEEVPPVRGETVDEQAHEAATSPQNELTEPSQAQIEAGNYKKGHVSLHGFDISIENPKGSVRKGVDENGKSWETKLAHHYGYIKGTIGKDKDHVDVFIGPKTDSKRVFVVDQVDPRTGKLDEHKVLMGFPNPLSARLGYLANYDKSGKERIGAITETTPEGLKEWFKNGDQKKPFGALKEGKNSDAQQGKAEKKAEVGDENEFVKTPDGAIDFGEISGDVAKIIKRESAPLRLRIGDESEGLRHIEKRHGKDITALGYPSVVVFVADITKNFDSVYSGKGSALDLVVTEGKLKFARVQLEPSEDGSYYDIKTATPGRSDQFKNKKPLWESAGPSVSSGENRTPLIPGAKEASFDTKIQLENDNVKKDVTASADEGKSGQELNKGKVIADEGSPENETDPWKKVHGMEKAAREALAGLKHDLDLNIFAAAEGSVATMLDKDWAFEAHNTLRIEETSDERESRATYRKNMAAAEKVYRAAVALREMVDAFGEMARIEEQRKGVDRDKSGELGKLWSDARYRLMEAGERYRKLYGEQEAKELRKSAVENKKIAEKTASQNAPGSVSEGEAIPEPGKTRNRERFKEAQRRHLQRKLAEARTEKDKAHYAKLLAKLKDYTTRTQAEQVPSKDDTTTEGVTKRNVAKRDVERALFGKLVADGEVLKIAGLLQGKDDVTGFAGQVEKIIAGRIRELSEQAETPAIRELYAEMLVDGKPVLPESFFKSLHKEAVKAYKQAEKEKNRDPEVYKGTLVMLSTRAGLSEGTEEYRQFKEGFDHALKGKTKSTLPQGEGRYVDGYTAARAWIGTDEGKAWFEGKRDSKQKSTGEALKRAWERQRKDLDGLEAGDMKTAWEGILRATTRADQFPILLDEDATPGARDWMERFRNGVATFQEFFMWEAQNVGMPKKNDLKYYGPQAIFTGKYTVGDRGRFGELTQKARVEFSEGKRTEKGATDAERLELAREIAREYQEKAQWLAQEFKGLSTLKEIGEVCERLFPGGRKAGVLSSSTYKENRGLIHGYREIGQILPSDYDYSAWKLLLEQEEKERDSKRSTPLVRPRLDTIVRTGLKDVRQGKSISAEEFKKIFGFADVTIGSYVTAQQAQDHLNYTHDALMTLADLLGAKPTQMSFGGRMHFAIGALGHGKAAAHFSPNHPKGDGTTVPVINVTNTRGDGAVLHEFFHALDFLTKDPALKKTIASVKRLLERTPFGPEQAVIQAERFLSGNSTFTNMGRNTGPRAYALYALETYYTGTKASNKTSFFREAENLDKGGGDAYWSNDVEPFARAAEAWGYDALKGKESRDDYLVSDFCEDGKATKPQFRGTPYARGKERTSLNALMARLIDAMEWTDSGPVLKQGHPWQETAPYAEAYAPYDKARKEAIEKIDEIRKAMIERQKEEKARKEQARNEEIFGKKPDEEETQVEQPSETAPSEDPEVGVSEDELASIFDEAAAELKEAEQEQPEQQPAGAALESQGWTREDMAEIREKVAAGRIVLLADSSAGLPTIHDFPSNVVRHMGYGTFQASTPEYEAIWDAGGAMDRTPSGKAYTVVHLKRGQMPSWWNKDDVLTIIDAWDMERQGRDKDRFTGSYFEGQRAQEKGEKRLPPVYLSDDKKSEWISGWDDAAKENALPSLSEEQEKTAAALAAEMAKYGVKGIDETLKGLVGIFGGGPNKLQSFPAGFDEDAYRQAKPHFEAAAKAFRQAGQSFRDFIKIFFKSLIQTFGEGIKPYAIQFAKDYEQVYSEDRDQAAPDTAAPVEATESPSAKLAEWVGSKLAAKESFTWQELFRTADGYFGGTQAQGVYDVKDAYDAMELGVNQHLLSIGIGNYSSQLQYDKSLGRVMKDTMGRLEELMQRLATQTKRTAEQNEFQQFSTPPTYAYMANWAANLRDEDIYLEPSAGIGGLAVFARMKGVKEIVVNELSARRLGLLRNLPFDRYFSENAEQLDNILPDDVKPTVIVMNPPFSSTAGRVKGSRDTMNGARHIEQALKRLAPGGRLVAIVGEGMGDGKPAFRDWWNKIKQDYNVRANIGIDGAGYAKYGTTFDNQILIIDKTAPDSVPVVTGNVRTPFEAMSLMAEVRNDRPATIAMDSQSAGQQGSGKALETEQGGQSPGSAGAPGTAAVGGGGRSTGNESGNRPGGNDSGRASGSGAHGQTKSGSEDTSQPGRSGERTDSRVDGKDAERGGNESDLAGEPSRSEITVETSQNAEAGEIGNSTFEEYAPKKINIPGSVQHVTPLVESAALASVVPPDPTYTPNLPRDVITKGMLSAAQLENVVYAGQAHEQMLTDGKTRRGYFIGDGTGVGKGREISGIIMDNWRQGRHKAVWISKKKELIKDAKRDFGEITGDVKLIIAHAKVKADGAITQKEGILFSAYPTLRSMSKAAREAVKGGAFGFPTYAVGSKVFLSPVASFGSEVGMTHDELKKLVKYHYIIKSPARRDEKGNIVYKAQWVNGGSIVDVHHAMLEMVDGKMVNSGAGKKDGISYQRIGQIVDWLGKDFDGVIVFDEAHEMGNAVPMKGKRGKSKPSDQALAALELQRALPNARVVYVSATGATEVSNLAYAERLGLWGEGTPFENVSNFISEMSLSVSAMELVAQNLKQLGLYQARSLSFDGVTYSRVEHAMTGYQRDTYDLLAGGWQRVLNDMDAALKDTGVLENDGKGVSRDSGKIKSAILSAFWGSHQRFFNQIITAGSMPSVLDQIDQDLAEGKSVVLQITNTNEADQERALAKLGDKEVKEGDEDTIEELDLTPREQLIQFIERAFPIYQYEQYTDGYTDDGKPIIKLRLVVDSKGKPVINKEALAKRDALIEAIRNIQIPDSPLQMLLNHFGSDQVAEITGRSQRVVATEDGKFKIEKRGEHAVEADAEAFKDGKKKILVFSQAGGTGFSFHSDRRYKNRDQRVHYILQPGWSADRAVQGLGRTHRTNQASPPIYRLVTTDVPAQKRFISSIARRLEQLGALTAGQRDTAGGSLFSASDNLESSYAQAAVRQFFVAALQSTQRNRPGYENIPSDLMKQMGLSGLIDETTGAINESRLPKVTQFLNRLLSLRLDTQAVVFDLFMEEVEQQIETAKQMGVFDDGLETINHKGARVVTEQEVYRDELTKAPTRYLKIEYKTPNPMYDFDEENGIIQERSKRTGNAAWFKNKHSGRVAGIFKASRTATTRDGRIEDVYGVKRTSGTSYESASKLVIDRWERIDEAEARAMWEKENSKRPEFRTHTLDMVVGGILPLWNRFNNQSVKVVRIATDDGRRFLGRRIMPKDLNETLSRLNVESTTAKMKGSEIVRAALNGSQVEFSNGTRLFPATVSGETRLELRLRNYPTVAVLQKMQDAGVIYEMIQYKPRYFVPTDEAKGGAAVDELMKVFGMNAYQVTSRNDEEGDTRFAAADRAMPSGLPAADIRAAFEPIYKNMPNAPAWRVVQTADELPARALQDAERRGIPRRMLQAVYLGNEVVYVADHFNSIQEAKEVILEEVVVHHGLRGIMARDTYDKHMLQAALWYANKRTAEWKSLARQYGLDLKTREGRIEAAEEMLGRDARTGKDASMLTRIIAAVKEYLRKIGFDIGYGEAEIRELLGKARRFVEGKGEYAKGIDFGAMVRKLKEQGITDEQLQAFAAYQPGGARYAAAWHGSPHDFDEFKLQYIGSGEGNAAYGWGLYFAGKKEIAEFYRENLAKGPSPVLLNGKVYKGTNQVENTALAEFAIYGDAITAMNELESRKGLPGMEDPEFIEEAIDWLRENQNGLSIDAPGRLYEVELAPEEDEYLLWDKPLSEQSEKVKEALSNIIDFWLERDENPAPDARDNLMSTMTGRYLYNYDNLWRAVDEAGSYAFDGDKSVSETLNSLGIRGIKYKDATSRNESRFPWQAGLPSDWEYFSDQYGYGIKDDKGLIQTEGHGSRADAHRHLFGTKPNFNYVIFDDSLVEVKAKFALAKLDNIQDQIVDKGVSLNTTEREVLEANRDKALEAISVTYKDYDEPGRYLFRAFYVEDQRKSPGVVPYNPEHGHYAAGEELKGSWWTTSYSTAQEIAWSKARDGRPVKIVALPASKLPAKVYIQNTNPAGFVYDLFVGLPSDVSIQDVREMPVDTGIRYALRDGFQQFSEKVAGKATMRNAAQTMNPLDWSRLKKSVDEMTPQNIRNGAAHFLRNPVFEAETDTNKRPFVEAGLHREETKLDYLLRFLGWDGPAAKAPNVMERLKKTYTQWGNSDRTTAWGRIADEYQKLSAADRKGVDLLLYRGDVDGKVYQNMEMVQADKRLAKVSEAAFANYQQVRDHIDTVVADAIEQMSRQFMQEAGLPDDVIEKHISDYRKRLERRQGWLPRNHGQGDHQVNVYHQITGLRWQIRGGNDTRQAYLPYFPSHDVALEIGKLAAAHGLKYRQLRNGQQLVTTDREATSRLRNEIRKLKQRLANLDPGELDKADAIELKISETERALALAQALPAAQIKRFIERAHQIIEKIEMQNDLRIREAKQALQDAREENAAATDIKRLEDELAKLGNGRIRVKVYMRLKETQRRADRHVEEVKANLKKYIPESHLEQESYVVETRFADKISEDMYGDMKNDFAMEQAQLTAIDWAVKRGEITKEKAASLRHAILQTTAEVLMARGSGAHQIRRAEYLVEGYDNDNTVDAYHSYMTGAAGMLSKARYAHDQFENYRYAKPEVKAWAEKYIKSNLRNMGFADAVSGNLRALASFAYLGFKVSSMIINATQPWILGVAELSRHTKRSAVAAIGKAQKDIVTGNLTDGEKKIFASELWKNQEMETAIHEMSGSGEGTTGKVSRFVRTLTDKALAPFQEVELLNRKTVILAAYRTFRADGVGRHEALQKALDVNRQVNFEMSRANLPAFAQKPLGRTVYALQSFMWNNWNWVFNRLTSGKKEDMLALLRYAAAMGVIGGMAALPGGDELDKLWQLLFGESPKLAFQKWTAAHAREYGTMGELINGFAWHGAASGAGVNISNAIRLQIPIVSPLIGGETLPEAAGGVFTGLMQKGTRAATSLSRGDIYRTIENLSPEALSGAMRAYRMATKGATTTSGKAVFDEQGRPVKYSAGEAAMRTLGFQPTNVSERTEITTVEKNLSSHWRDERADLLAELRIAEPGADRKKVMLKVIDFNRRLRGSQASGLVPLIKANTISNALSSKPNKRKAEWEQKQLLN